MVLTCQIYVSECEDGAGMHHCIESDSSTYLHLLSVADSNSDGDNVIVGKGRETPGLSASALDDLGLRSLGVGSRSHVDRKDYCR